MSKPKYPMVLVEWVDSCSPSRVWGTAESLRTYNPVTVKSVGFLVKDDKRGITIVQGLGAESDPDACLPMAIPRGCVKKIKRLKE